MIKPSTFSHIDNFLEEKKNAPLKERDATGLFLAYLQVHAKISTFKISGRFDVGNLEQYIECSNAFSSWNFLGSATQKGTLDPVDFDSFMQYDYTCAFMKLEYLGDICRINLSNRRSYILYTAYIQYIWILNYSRTWNSINLLWMNMYHFATCNQFAENSRKINTIVLIRLFKQHWILIISMIVLPLFAK